MPHYTVPISLPVTVATVFGLYLLSLCSLFLHRWQHFPTWAWPVGVALTLGLATGFGLASWQAIIPLSIVGLSGWVLTRFTGWLNLLGWIGLVLSTLALATHLAPGFDNWKIINSATIGSSTLPYSLYANLDKALGGLLLLAILIDRSALRLPTLKSYANSWPHFVISIVIVFGLGLLLGVDFEPKIGSFVLIFAFFNLFV